MKNVGTVDIISNSFVLPVPLNVSSAGIFANVPSVVFAVPVVNTNPVPASLEDACRIGSPATMNAVLPPVIVKLVTMPPATTSTVMLEPLLLFGPSCIMIVSKPASCAEVSGGVEVFTNTSDVDNVMTVAVTPAMVYVPSFSFAFSDAVTVSF